MRTTLLTLAVATCATLACGGPEETPAADSGPPLQGPIQGPIKDAGDGGSARLDTSPSALTAFAKSKAYEAWRAEPAKHASEGPHGQVRTFVNDVLYESMKAGNTTHPPGSVTVKELFGKEGDAITGHAINVKNESGTWFFYEGFTSSDYEEPYHYEGTSNFCAGCHNGGTDYVLVQAAAFP